MPGTTPTKLDPSVSRSIYDDDLSLYDDAPDAPAALQEDDQLFSEEATNRAKERQKRREERRELLKKHLQAKDDLEILYHEEQATLANNSEEEEQETLRFDEEEDDALPPALGSDSEGESSGRLNTQKIFKESRKIRSDDEEDEDDEVFSFPFSSFPLFFALSRLIFLFVFQFMVMVVLGWNCCRRWTS